MTDLRTRMQIYDQAPVPELWAEVSVRARAASLQTGPRTHPSRLWIALAAAAVTVLIGGAILIGSGAIELPIPPEPVPAPSTSATPSELVSPAPTLPPIDPGAGSWSATGPMVNTYWEGFTATLLSDGSVLVAGGVAAPSTRNSSYNRAEIFDPVSMSWTAAGDMIEGRYLHAAVLMSGSQTVLATGGYDPPTYTGDYFSSVESFDMARMDWSPLPGMIGPRALHQAVVLLDGRVFVAGGGQMFAEVFDPTAGVLSWTRTADMLDLDTSGHVESATLLADGRVLTLGGIVPQLFDPATGTWSRTEPMARQPVRGAWGEGTHTATRLLDGRVLVAGGGECCVWTNAAELFDPTTDSWSETGSMAEFRSGFTATLLRDGRVLVTGGGDGGYGGRSTAEVYDPDSGTWTAAPDMLSRHGYHEAVALADGRVLVVGGYDGRYDARSGGDNSPAEPEVFDPFGAQ